MQREEQPPRTIKAATISVLGVSMEEPQLEAAHNLHQTPSQEFLPENFGERSDHAARLRHAATEAPIAVVVEALARLLATSSGPLHQITRGGVSSPAAA